MSEKRSRVLRVQVDFQIDPDDQVGAEAIFRDLARRMKRGEKLTPGRRVCLNGPKRPEASLKVSDEESRLWQCVNLRIDRDGETVGWMRRPTGPRGRTQDGWEILAVRPDQEAVCVGRVTCVDSRKRPLYAGAGGVSWKVENPGQEDAVAYDLHEAAVLCLKRGLQALAPRKGGRPCVTG